MSLTVSEILTTLKDSEKVDMTTPQILYNYLLVLSSHVNQAGMMILEAHIAYSKRWRELKGDSTVKETDMAIMAEPEYKTLEQAKYAKEALTETIRAIKYVLKTKIEESHNQM